jgi:hypothetical protein
LDTSVRRVINVAPELIVIEAHRASGLYCASKPLLLNSLVGLLLDLELALQFMRKSCAWIPRHLELETLDPFALLLNNFVNWRLRRIYVKELPKGHIL